MTGRACATRAHRFRFLGVAVLGVVLLATGCSSSDASRPGAPNGTLAPLSKGASCDDPAGDLGTDANTAGSSSALPGIDLVHADAKVTDHSLLVSFTTAGPIGAPGKTPIFVLSQGPAGMTVSFELRASPGPDPSKPWGIELVTWKVTSKGTDESRGAVAETATVNGNTLTYEIPLRELPAIATLIWQFGATSGDDANPVFDDCNNFSNSASGTLPAPTVAPSTGPTTTLPDLRLGDTRTHPNGAKVTVFDVQSPPPANVKINGKADDGNQLAVVDAQVCAGDKPYHSLAGYFGLKSSDNTFRAMWDKSGAITDAAFPLTTDLQPGACVRGWVPFQIKAGTTVLEAYYEPNAAGDDALVWNLS